MVKGWRWPNDRQGKHRGTGGGFWDILTGKGPDMYVGDFRDDAPDWTQWGRWPEQGAWPWHYDDSALTPPWARRGYESYDPNRRRYRKRYPPPERFIYPPAHRHVVGGAGGGGMPGGAGGGGGPPWSAPAGFDSSPWPEGPGPWVKAGVNYGLAGGAGHMLTEQRPLRRPRIAFPKSLREANADWERVLLLKPGSMPQVGGPLNWAGPRWEDRDPARKYHASRRYPSWSSESTDWPSDQACSEDDSDWRTARDYRKRRF